MLDYGQQDVDQDTRDGLEDYDSSDHPFVSSVSNFCPVSTCGNTTPATFFVHHHHYIISFFVAAAAVNPPPRIIVIIILRPYHFYMT